MNHRLLVDINILLDVLADRQPHYAASAAIWTASETGVVTGLVSANSITTLYYLLRKLSSHATALRSIKFVSQIFNIVPMDGDMIDRAIESLFTDFDDAVQHEAALKSRATAIITRDTRHFRHAAMPVLTPDAFLAQSDLK